MTSDFRSWLASARLALPRLALLAALAPVLGCIGQTAGDDVNQRGDDINGPDYGVDYAWARPSPSSLRADGYGFVCRYLSYDTTGKNISAGEASALEAAGLDIVLNWEWGAQDVLDGYSKGVSEAQEAEAQAKAVGQPAGRPIYFSIDFDAQPGDQAAINAYFDGVASVIGRNRTGAYGGYGVINRLFNDGKITWGWQTYAWSGGAWDSRAQLRQIQNDIGPGGEMDEDRSTVSDFGQWGGSGGTPTATPCNVGGVAGTCMDTSVCAGMAGHVSTPGYCPGPASEECCTVDMSAPPKCTVGGVSGVCIDKSNCAAMAGHVSTPGYCPGPASEECCTETSSPAPPPPPPPAPTCSVDGVSGTCIDKSVCAGMAGHVSTPGYCPGPATEECCTPVASAPSCNADGLAGVCIATSACASEGRISIAGFCPGPASEECCVKEPTGPSCTVENVSGSCIDKGVCMSMPGHVSTPGFCPGPASEECCTAPPKCDVGGVAGLCMETTVCASLGHHSHAGYCPGPANEECCTP